MGSTNLIKLLYSLLVIIPYSAWQSMNLCKIKKEIFWNTENQTLGSWVKCVNATSVLGCPSFFKLLMKQWLSLPQASRQIWQWAIFLSRGQSGWSSLSWGRSSQWRHQRPPSRPAGTGSACLSKIVTSSGDQQWWSVVDKKTSYKLICYTCYGSFLIPRYLRKRHSTFMQSNGSIQMQPIIVKR